MDNCFICKNDLPALDKKATAEFITSIGATFLEKHPKELSKLQALRSREKLCAICAQKVRIAVTLRQTSKKALRKVGSINCCLCNSASEPLKLAPICVEQFVARLAKFSPTSNPQAFRQFVVCISCFHNLDVWYKFRVELFRYLEIPTGDDDSSDMNKCDHVQLCHICCEQFLTACSLQLHLLKHEDSREVAVYLQNCDLPKHIKASKFAAIEHRPPTFNKPPSTQETSNSELLKSTLHHTSKLNTVFSNDFKLFNTLDSNVSPVFSTNSDFSDLDCSDAITNCKFQPRKRKRIDDESVIVLDSDDSDTEIMSPKKVKFNNSVSIICYDADNDDRDCTVIYDIAETHYDESAD